MEGGTAMKKISLSRLEGLRQFPLTPFARWGKALLLPLAFAAVGFLVGMVASRGAEILFRRHLLDGVHSWALRTDGVEIAPSTDPLSEGLKSFVEANPFGVDRQARSAVSDSVTTHPGRGSFRDARLVGTLPPEGAFVVFEEALIFLLRGQSEGGYELVDVTPDKAFFRDGQDQELILILEFAKAGAPVTEKAAPQAEAASTPPPPSGNVTAAAPGKEGAVDRDLVNSLLMNPFEELRKIRLQPHVRDGRSVGIEVRFIRDNSILHQLGVSRGDVIQAVNGVQIQNMNDVANAISSLMGGSRFDVSVLRGGESVELSYTVK